MPVVVEVDCDDDKVTRVVTLPEEFREDSDDMGHFLIFDEKFVRRDSDEQPQVHAFCGGEPCWEHPQFRVGGPVNWLEDRGVGRGLRPDRGGRPVRGDQPV